MSMNKREKSVADLYRKRSRGAEIWRNFRKNKGAMIALAYLILLFIVALTADLWISTDQIAGMNVKEKLQTPNAAHWFGTDDMGRDLFWRVLYGARSSLAIGFVAVMISLVVGVPLGAIAGYFGGRTENIIMRIIDIFAAIPNILMSMVIVAVLGQKIENLMLAVGIAAVPSFTRITRAAVLTVKNNEYIEAARALGKTNAYIIFHQILPNCLSPIIVQVTLRVAGAIISASSLSFLGIGVKPPTPEWGALLNAGNSRIRSAPYLTIFPGLAIMITVLAFNLVGDGIRDAMDPKLKH